MSAPTVVRDPGEIDFNRPGKHHYQVAFHLDSGWGYSLVPMTVINGTAGAAAPDTPGVVAFGGTHGNEYEGQVAVKRLCNELDPARMRGRVILIPQLSESACRAHQRCSGEDGVNMNRAFPGDPRGTVSYRISNFVKTRIFPQVRVVARYSRRREGSSVSALRVFPPAAGSETIRRDRDSGATVRHAVPLRLLAPDGLRAIDR